MRCATMPALRCHETLYSRLQEAAVVHSTQARDIKNTRSDMKQQNIKIKSTPCFGVENRVHRSGSARLSNMPTVIKYLVKIVMIP